MQPTFSWFNLSGIKQLLSINSLPLVLKDSWYSYMDTKSKVRFCFHKDMLETVSKGEFMLRKSAAVGPKIGEYTQLIACLPTQKPDLVL